MAEVRIPLPDEHTLQIEYSRLTGREHIRYDGDPVSGRRCLGFVSAHVFRVTEGGHAVVYEVNLYSTFLDMRYVVRRDGIPVAHSP
jgi:hypothetical protein